MGRSAEIEKDVEQAEEWKIAPRVLGELLETARRSATADNSQHWRFSWDGRGLDIQLDLERAASFLNFRLVETYLSLGGLLEDLEICAQGLGVSLEVVLAGDQPEARVIPRPFLCRAHPLAGALKRRRTNRGAYENTPLPAFWGPLLSEVADDIGVHLNLLNEPSSIRAASQVLSFADRLMFSHREIHQSLFRWIRWTPGEAAATRDGLSLPGLMLPPIARRVLGWVRSWPLSRLFSRLGFGKLTADSMARGYAKTGAVGFLLIDTLDPASLVRAGRAFERLWLTATELGLALQPMTRFTLLDLRRRFGAGEGLSEEQEDLLERGAETLAQLIPDYLRQVPVLAFRLGTALSTAEKSLRRPLSELMAEPDQDEHQIVRPKPAHEARPILRPSVTPG